MTDETLAPVPDEEPNKRRLDHAEIASLGREVWRYFQQRANNQVLHAIKRGEIPELDGRVLCVDCGQPAAVYEHRDYAKPLDVEPTCQSCNLKRGPASLDPEFIRAHLYIARESSAKRSAAPEPSRRLARQADAVEAPAVIATVSLNFSHLTPKQQAFLLVYSQNHNVTHAARAAGIARRTLYEWTEADAAFREAYKCAAEMAVDNALQSAWLQGVVGTREPVFYKGDIVGYIRRREPSMTKLILQAFRPDEFKDRSETTHKGSIRAMAAPPWMAYLSDEELERLSSQTEDLRKLAEARMNPPPALPEKGSEA